MVSFTNHTNHEEAPSYTTTFSHLHLLSLYYHESYESRITKITTQPNFIVQLNSGDAESTTKAKQSLEVFVFVFNWGGEY